MNKSEIMAAIAKAKELGISFETFSRIYKAQLTQPSEKSGATSIYIVRHAETPFNTGDTTRIRSITDLSLDTNGLLAANYTGIELRNEGIECIYTSDMLRAQQTARAIQLNNDAKIEIYPQFRAWNLGSLAGKNAKKVDNIIMDLVNNPNSLPPDSNESYNMFVKRNLEGYKSAIQFNGGVAIVTHQSNCIAILENLGMKECCNVEPGCFVKIL